VLVLIGAASLSFVAVSGAGSTSTPASSDLHADVVPLILWTSAQDSYAAAEFGAHLNRRLAKIGQRLSSRECSPGHFPDIEQTPGFEDPEFLRDPASVVAAHPRAELAIDEARHAVCSPTLRTAAERSYVRVESLRLQWQARMQALEHEEPIVAARNEFAACMSAHGYQSGRYVGDPRYIALPEQHQQVQVDQADCLAPVVGTITAARVAARAAFVASHQAEVQAVRAAFRQYFRLVDAPHRLQRSPRRPPVAPSSAAGSPTVDTRPNGPIAAPEGVTTRMELESTTAPAGSIVHGWLVVTNSTAGPVDLTDLSGGCRPKYGVYLVNEALIPAVFSEGGFTTDCSGEPFIIPRGVHRFPLVLGTNSACGGTTAPGYPQAPPCTPAGGVPALPVGTYTARLGGSSLALPTPATIAVTLVEPT
jgi:hypothetical protein